MKEPKRGAKCPFGSGHKYRKCCGPSWRRPSKWQRKMWANLVERFLTGE
jgi:uncharacterized protein YchJ